MQQVMELTDLPEVVIVENAALVNEKILHNYSEFAISTIDAFFQRIVKSFAKELGLLGSYKVELDQDSVMQELIDELIDELGSDPKLTGWLVNFSFSRVDDHKAWNIRPEIEYLSAEIFKESFRKVKANLMSWEKLDELMKHILQVKSKFEGFMQKGAKAAIHLIEKSGLLVTDFAYGHAGPAGYFDKILKKQEFEPGKRLLNALVDTSKWSSKSSSSKAEILLLVDQGLNELTQSLVDYYNQNHSEYITALELQKNLYVFGILSKILEKLDSYRQENDVMLISDVAVFLNDIIADNEAPFIYEKTGSWYRHYLIDEFQDTSGFQWQNFKPLVENGISQHFKSLLVGDGKQSIYRWRGGDWNLILQEVASELKNYQPKDIALDTNWRSDRRIIGFNNAVFSFLSAVMCNGFRDEVHPLKISEQDKQRLLNKAQDVEHLYQDVTQKVAPQHQAEARGIIQVNAYQKSEGKTWKESALDELPQRIEALQDQGFAASDLAILVRKGADGKKVIEELLRYKNSNSAKAIYCYDAISNESLYLGNSTAIRLIINAIKIGMNPDDAIAKAEMQFNYQYLKGEQNDQISGSDLNNDEVFSFTEDISATISSMISLPPYELVERLVQLLELGTSRDKGYIQAFQDLVLEYFASEHHDMADFLSWWEDKGKSKSMQLPAEMNAIRVMTIHKSKGLEFGAVILPFCDWKIDHDANKNIIWCKAEKLPFNNAGYLPLRYSKELAKSFFAPEYFQEKINAGIDNLNLLYVALTRAEKHLIINCPPKSREKLTTVGDLMLNAIDHLHQESREDLEVRLLRENEECISYQIGNEMSAKATESKASTASAAQVYRSSDWREKIAIRKKGSDYFDVDFSEQKEKINFGILVHDILAKSHREEDVEPLIEQSFAEGTINQKEKQTLTEQLQMIFANPEVKSWFDNRAEVKVEVPIIANEKAEKRPDRVLIDGRNATVIDFKTGSEVSGHKKQVMMYRSLLLKMGYKNVDAFLLYISNNKVVKVA